MDDAVTRRHPLHVAGPDAAAIAGAVFMDELAFEHVGHGLEAAMRVIGRAHGLARPVVGRTHLVEQQERIDDLQPGHRKRAANDEAATLLLALGVNDAMDFAR